VKEGGLELNPWSTVVQEKDKPFTSKAAVRAVLVVTFIMMFNFPAILNFQ
jgi:hypothetical protein